ncbi:MAG TPA: ATP-binding protein [Steroidobacteraceae bacterium]|jgi:signal transduction histidine kinase|nr:ATP-binding protein [Steroidobacteraceae bacterium]
MAFSNFRVNVVLRALLIVALCFGFAWAWVETHWQVTPFVCGVLIVLAVTELIRYIEKTTREFTSFLSFVTHNDFSVPVPTQHKGGAFDELEAAYRLLTGKFRHMNLQKAADHQYLEAVVEHISIALVCLDEQNNVKMINSPVRRLFGLPYLNSLRSFARIDARLPDLLERLDDGERTLFAVRLGDETLQLVLYATRFTLLDRRYKLVSFQNIRDELDQREIDSWQKLIRVLTHEIMNSVTPIISLSKLVSETLVDGDGSLQAMTRQEQDDLQRSVAAIHARSSGLLDFVQAYRSLTNLPAPVFAEVQVVSLLERVRTLMSQELAERNVPLVLTCDDATLVFRADPGQMEQVLINLLRNALEALADVAGPRIELRAQRDERGKLLLQVVDNGPGIDPAHLDSIFVPFFTTKRNGTGVGLSISRQIVQMNKGFISVRSEPGDCAFTLKFR